MIGIKDKFRFFLFDVQPSSADDQCKYEYCNSCEANTTWAGACWGRKGLSEADSFPLPWCSEDAELTCASWYLIEVTTVMHGILLGKNDHQFWNNKYGSKPQTETYGVFKGGCFWKMFSSPSRLKLSCCCYSLLFIYIFTLTAYHRLCTDNNLFDTLSHRCKSSVTIVYFRALDLFSRT